MCMGAYDYSIDAARELVAEAGEDNHQLSMNVILDKWPRSGENIERGFAMLAKLN